MNTNSLKASYSTLRTFTVHEIHFLQIEINCCESNGTTKSILQRVNIHLTEKNL